MNISDILNLKNLVVMGDYNSVLHTDESWGSICRPDPLAGYISHSFETHHMFDIRPNPMLPTWSNKRQGEDYIAKRLDRAMVKGHLINLLGDMRFHLHISDISDHMAVILSWRLEAARSGIPFKFNRA